MNNQEKSIINIHVYAGLENQRRYWGGWLTEGQYSVLGGTTRLSIDFFEIHRAI